MGGGERRQSQPGDAGQFSEAALPLQAPPPVKTGRPEEKEAHKTGSAPALHPSPSLFLHGKLFLNASGFGA